MIVKNAELETVCGITIARKVHEINLLIRRHHALCFFFCLSASGHGIEIDGLRLSRCRAGTCKRLSVHQSIDQRRFPYI